MTPHLNTITRTEKRTISVKVGDNLNERAKQGPAEPGLDAFIPELTAIAGALDAHVTGKVLADAARQNRLARAETADINVDTWLRHIESFIYIEAHRRAGPDVDLAQGLYAAACPEGLAHVDDRIVDENAHCRDMLSVLKATEHAEAIARIGLPLAWIAAFEAALVESEAAIADVIQARDDKSTHVGKGRDAEQDWVDLMVRLRRYVGSRARRTDRERVREGKELLKPLLDALAKLHADAAARATRRATRAGTTEAEEGPAESPASV